MEVIDSGAHAFLQRGTSLTEVLVTIVILAFGLLGLAGLQSRMQVSEVESYQRAQALMLLNDMAQRMTVNRSRAVDYVTVDPLGAGMVCPVDPETRQEIDSAEWCHALQGAAVDAGGNRVGAMVGGRGCVDALPNNEYMVTVAWQGQAPVSAPPASVGCGAGEYDAAGTSCTDDRCRRVVTTVLRIASLD